MTGRQLCLCVVATLGWSLGEAAAQNPYAPPNLQRSSRPTVSPYLNLLRPGSTASNYYNLVRPQLQFQSAVQNLQQEITTSQQSISGLQFGLGTITQPPTGGNRVRFLDTGGAFMNMGGGTAGPSRVGAPAAPIGAGPGTLRAPAQQAPAVARPVGR